MVEVEKDFARKGTAGAGLGLGIAGTALGLLNGGLPNLLGGLGGCGAAMCSENMPVSRYEQSKENTISELRAQLALRDSTIFTDQKSLELYKYIDGQLKEVRDALCAQAVHPLNK